MPSSCPTVYPTLIPSSQPTNCPSSQPSYIPTRQPTSLPSTIPSSKPSTSPTYCPSSKPTSIPSSQPSCEPSSQPTSIPSNIPSSQPSCEPSSQPTSIPSNIPSSNPSSYPTSCPVSKPTSNPSNRPSSQPSLIPISQPTAGPSSNPTSGSPTSRPSSSPSVSPSSLPSSQPSSLPSSQPTTIPTSQPSCHPTSTPSTQPSSFPSTIPSSQPSSQPSSIPSVRPTRNPTPIPTNPFSAAPSLFPTLKPTYKIGVPTPMPSFSPTFTPEIITTIAGTSLNGYNNDSILADLAKLNYPLSISLDISGNIYISDTNNHRIRKINNLGIITTIAGTGEVEFNNDNKQATSSNLYQPHDVVSDNIGNVYIADSGNHRIRKMEISLGYLTTIAGTGLIDYYGDKIEATLANLYYPSSIAINKNDGSIIISDTNNHRIRKINTLGIITTTAGTGLTDYNGDNIHATSANLYFPLGLIFDSNNNIYVADSANNRVRKISSIGIISTIAGTSTSGFSGDFGQATLAELDYPYGITMDTEENIYISDSDNHRIRKVTTTGIINTFAGNGEGGFYGDQGSNSLAQLFYPGGISCDNIGSLFIADTYNHRIRKITPSSPTMIPTYQPTYTANTPTPEPSLNPTANPTYEPSKEPTTEPTTIEPTLNPTAQPSNEPTLQPTYSANQPTPEPSFKPTRSPTLNPTLHPTFYPTYGASSCLPYAASLTSSNTINFAICEIYACPGVELVIDGGCSCNGDQLLSLVNSSNTVLSTNDDSCSICSKIIYHTIGECQTYTIREGCFGSRSCSGSVSVSGALVLTASPTTSPTVSPTFNPTLNPTTGTPSFSPTAIPSEQPTLQPTYTQGSPTPDPSLSPTTNPTLPLTSKPSSNPSSIPTGQPTGQPSLLPSSLPTSQPSTIPTRQPSSNPTSQPSNSPSSIPSSLPSSQPSSSPTYTVVVNIVGSQSRIIHRSDSLMLDSYIYSNGVIPASFFYSWSVFNDDVEDFSIKSISKDESKFKLNPYQLLTNREYKVYLTLTNAITLHSLSTFIDVFIEQSSIEAIIKGGIQQSIKVNELILIDASYSYDKDIDGGITGMKSGLSFNWTCVTIKPFSSSNCPININPLSLLLDVLELISTVSSVNTTAKITVTVSDSTRSSNAFIELTILNNDASIVQITSSFLESINPKKNLILNANVESKDNSCNAIWTIDDESIPQSKALTPILTYIPIGNVYFLTFVIVANQLPERNSYKITLHCSDSFSSIFVTTNGPPMNGSFSVLPSSGLEFETVFSFSTELWNDDDIPITYQFGFFQVNSYIVDTMISQGRSENDNSYTSLASGLELYNYSVSCIVQIFDSLDCFTTSSVSVSVNKDIESDINVVELIDIKSSTIYSMVDRIKQVCNNFLFLFNKIYFYIYFNILFI
jgi:sugar lactone lactonase YvrE